MLEQEASITCTTNSFLSDVLEGLSQESKSLSCKYFYDERGSKLFEKICGVPEYYLTDCELEIMKNHASEMAANLKADSILIEFGSGSSTKTRYLLDSIQQPIVYVPVDVSAAHLQQSVEKLESVYPHIRMEPIAADFTQPIPFPNGLPGDSPATVYFPGSTIGNFSPPEAADLFEIIVSEIGLQGGLIIGIDLKKDPQTIESAYNDSQGITAEFNLNLLHRINRELDGNLVVDQFQHRSVYDESLGRIETSIVSLCDQEASIAGERFTFEKGEEIHTEYSYKYDIEEFARFAAEFGMRLEKSWTDSQGYFAVLHLVVE